MTLLETVQAHVTLTKVGRHWRFRKGAIDRWLEKAEANEPDSGGD